MMHDRVVLCILTHAADCHLQVLHLSSFPIYNKTSNKHFVTVEYHVSHDIPLRPFFQDKIPGLPNQSRHPSCYITEFDCTRVVFKSGQTFRSVLTRLKHTPREKSSILHGLEEEF